MKETSQSINLPFDGGLQLPVLEGGDWPEEHTVAIEAELRVVLDGAHSITVVVLILRQFIQQVT
jgi:hypothetical protein